MTRAKLDTPLPATASPYETALPSPSGEVGAFIEREAVIVEPGLIVFGKYLVKERLGKGGMGEVWLVLDTELDVRRALKMITQGTGFNSEARARFRREARAMAKFTHPNVVTVHDSRLDHRDVAYIVMEYVSGKSLEKILKSGQPMPLDWTLKVLRQLCDALQEAHLHKIIHRDLKPSNLILVDSPSKRDQLKVFDFGIAKILQSEEQQQPDEALTMMEAFMGTPPYASPEQASGRAEPASDIYSVGVILFEFLTGYRPFVGKPQALIANTMLTPPPSFHTVNPSVKVPAGVERVVMRCLAKKPEDRPQTPQALLDEFEAAVNAGRPPEPGKKKAKTPLNPLSWIIPVASVAVLALVVVVATMNKPKKKEELTPPVPPGAHQEIDGRSFTLWSSGKEEVYLPDGYEVADRSKLAEGRWPREILRHADGVRFIRITGGTFQMGAREGAKSSSQDNQPEHSVTLPGFYIQKHEVTNKEVRAYILANPNRFVDRSEVVAWEKRYESLKQKKGEASADKYPATNLSWKFASEFARSHQGRLPLEAQFEYAARSGELGTRNTNDLVWSDLDEKNLDMKELANINNEDVTSVEVGTMVRDVTGQNVCDLVGNVREWCRDPFLPYTKADLTLAFSTGNLVPPPDTMMVVRGGSYSLEIESRYTNYRGPALPISSEVPNDLGFRLVIECPEVPSPTSTSTSKAAQPTP